MFYNVGGIGLFYTTNGSKMPTLLMHGGMGLDHTYFRPWLDPLANQMQLIYYDHRGNGQSTHIADFTGIDHKTWADDADALRRHLGHDKIVLLGHSCGGFVAMEYARRYGRHLAGLILCCTSPAMDYPDVIKVNAKARSTPEQLQVIGRLFTTPLTSNEEYQQGFHTLLSLYFKSYNPAIGAAIINSIKFNYHAYNNTAAVLFPSFNSLGWLNQIRVPTLIIGGKYDWIMPPAQGAERLHAGIPNSELLILENSGHFPFVEERERFSAAVLDWANRLKGL
jgi:proline iminopeptidase